MRDVLRRTGQVLIWSLLTVVVSLALAIVIVPMLMGWVPLTILSGSMEPTIPTGSQVIVEPVEDEDQAAALGIGDVITVMPYPEDPTLVTHRIISRTVTGDGVSFITQGDANEEPDPEAVTATQLRGVVRYHVPYAGYVAQALTAQQKSIGVTVAAVALLGYAGWQLLSAVRRRGEDSHDAGTDRPPQAGDGAAQAPAARQGGRHTAPSGAVRPDTGTPADSRPS